MESSRASGDGHKGKQLHPRTSMPHGRDRTGSVAILFTLMFTVLLGFTALATEIGLVLLKQREMQTAASAAALGGATALMTGHPTFTVEADAIATQAGFTGGTANGVVTTVTVNNPPKAGNHVGNASYVEVVILQPQSLSLSSLFGITAWQISARAVAIEGNNAGDCLLQLGTASNPGISITQGATINASQCGIASDSAESEALYVSGATLTAASVTTVGQVVGTADITSTKPIQSSQPAVADPYAAVVVPTYSGCASSATTLYTSGTTTLNPSGTSAYCGGIQMGGGGTVTMNPGLYIMNGGVFTVSGGVTVNGTGVTIVMTGSGTNWAYLTLESNATVNLSAPTTGATAGLVFYQDRNTPTSSSYNDTFDGGSTMTLTGALYFPSETVAYSNGTVTNGSIALCTQLIANVITFTGGATFANSGCGTAGVSTIGGTPSQLTE